MKELTWDEKNHATPCERCKQVKDSWPCCDGRYLCKECWKDEGEPMCQLYPGDRGFGLPVGGV